MSIISLNSNVNSLRIQSDLNRVSKALESNFSHLSSGLRINRASDDAAGLSVAAALRADEKVYSQGARNFADGVSALSIAEGALTELSNIVSRQSELAQQASNGTFSAQQRLALHREGVALVDEFNRIVASAEFNSTRLFSLNQSTVTVQGGYGANGGIGFTIGAELDQNVGTSSFSPVTTFGAGVTPRALTVADFNGDGHSDYISVDDGLDALTVRLGNGNGTFSLGAAVNSVANNSIELISADFNNDGFIDLAHANNAGTTTILLGNGNGTFKTGTGVVASAHDLYAGDFNNDGKIDIAGTNAASDAFIQLGNGDGTFTAMTTIITGQAGASLDTFAGDFNMDGNLDLEFSRSGAISYLFGNGNGTFRTGVSLAVNPGNPAALAADFNRDGYLDLVTNDNNQNFAVFMNNGDGTFKARATYLGGGALINFAATDFNGDGMADLIVADSSATIYSYLGNGDGTFKARVVTSVGNGFSSSMGIVDFNEDGAPDIVGIASGLSTTNVVLQQTTVQTAMDSFDLTTQQNARNALTMLSATQKRVNSEQGSVGAYTSRIGYGISVLNQMTETYATARSQIEDVDVAFETAQLVRNKIVQSAAAAVLAQANQAPKLALQLIADD